MLDLMFLLNSIGLHYILGRITSLNTALAAYLTTFLKRQFTRLRNTVSVRSFLKKLLIISRLETERTLSFEGKLTH